MKHNSLFSANGLLHNPLASTTIKSSFATAIFKPLLMLFLLVMGSSVVWAWNVRGEGLPGLNTCTDCGNWDSNIIEMAGIGNNTYCATFLNVAAESGNRYRLKICDGWKGTDNLDQSKSNVNFVDAGDKRISFTIPFLSNVFVFYNSSTDKIWVIAVPVNASNYSGSNYIRQDLGLNASGWLSNDNGGVKFTSSSAYVKHVAAFVIPKGMQWRYEIYNSGGTKKVEKTTVTADGSATRLAFVVWDGSSSSASVTLMPYVIKKSGWKLYVDDVDQGTVDANGDITVSNMPAASHTFYFTNGVGTTYHGINYFGGCYVNTTVSSSLFSNHQYYKTDAVGTFTVPTIDTKGTGSNAGYYMFPKGKFTLTGGAKDVTFNFDGGVITINAVESGTILPTDRTYDGTEYMFFNKNQTCTEGDHPSFDFSKDDARLYVHFRNASTSVENTPERAFFWDADKTILAVKVPAGTYKKFQIYRISRETAGWYEWNHSYELPLDYTTKNYLSATSTTAATWDTYTPPTFRFVLSGTAAMTGDNSDFAHWNGNGTVYTGSTTKDLNSGTYKFKINPAGVTTANNMWVNEFNWNDIDLPNSSNNINLRKGTDNGEIWFDLANRSQVTIACDGSKVTVVATPVQQYTVTFNTDGGSIIDPVQVSDGSPVAQPADPTKDGYTFVKWQRNGSDYNFSNPATGNITLDAVWAYKAIESVSLNKSSLTLFENSTPQTLTASYLPADAIGVTYSWSVSPAGVVNVVDGVVSVVASGTATITCTATDQESHSQTTTCAVTVHAGEGCVMEEQDIFSHTILGNSTTGGSASHNLPDGAALNAGMEPTCRKIKMYYDGLTSEFTADEGGVVKAKSGLSDHSDEWYEIKGGSNANSYDGNFYYLKNVATGGYITRGDGQYGNNADWYYYTTITTPTNGKTNLYQFIYTKKDGQDNQKRICSVWNYNGTGSNQSYGLHRKNQEWADNYSAHCPSPMIVFGHGVNQGGGVLNVNFTVVEASAANPDYLSTPIVYDTRSYYRFAQDAAISMTLDKKLREDDKIVVYCYNPSNAESNGGLYINNNNVSAISIPANSAIEFEYVAIAADADKNAIAVKSDDNNFCVAAVNVLRSLPVAAEDPELAWSAPATYYTTIAAGNFTFAASSAKSSGAISYTSSDETVATVVDGVVTPLTIGTTTITASIEQYLCFGESSIQYDVVVEPSLQEAIDATPVKGTLILTHDYNDNAVIDKAITINGGDHTIGDLKIENTGDLTLSSGLTVRDFTICAKAGNTSTPAASGQVRNAANLTCNRNAYFLYTVDPNGHVQYGWYDFTVPFPVQVMSGIKGIQDNDLNEDFVNERDYAIMEYLGDRKAQGQYPYKKFRGEMQPNQLYSITLDNRDNYNTVRFQKTADGALVTGNNVTLHAYAGSGAFDNLNGVGNGTLHHADAGNLSAGFVQVYQSGDKTFLTVDKTQYSFVVGTAFMVQEAGTMTLNQATHAQLLAPARQASAPATAIQIAREGQPFSDQLFISASETGGQAYTPGTDLAKAGDLGSANVPQIWTNAYNNPLCVHEAQLINGEASYNLSIYAPAADTYTLTSRNIPADYSLYLTQNGTMLTELNGTYTLDLNKGITTEYGLLLVETYKTPTGIEESGIRSQESGIRKILHNGVLYILHNGKIYNAQGGKVCDL